MSLPYKAEVKHDQDGYGRASNQRPYWMVEPKIFSQGVIPRWRVTWT
jgi:hypothetical protein